MAEKEATAAGDSLDDQWQELSSFWVDYSDPDRYPTMTRVWLDGGFDTAGQLYERTLIGLMTVIDAAVMRSR